MPSRSISPPSRPDRIAPSRPDLAAISPAELQVGFASKSFQVLSDAAGHSPDGVGDDGESWAADGVRLENLDRSRRDLAVASP